MKRLQIAVMLLSIIIAGVGYGQGVDVQIKASLDFVELVHEVASWVKGAFSRHDENEMRRIAESVPKLSGQLSDLAGDKNALANYLTSYNSDTDKVVFERGYRDKVQQLNQKLKDIQRTIDDMDPNWKGSNPMANFKASSAVAQKELFLHEYGMPDDLFEVNLTELANAYNHEAFNLLRSAVEISKTLQGHNNGSEPGAPR